MFYECPYCSWCGEEPNPAAYPDTDEGQEQYEAAIAAFRDAQDNHPCKGV